VPTVADYVGTPTRTLANALLESSSPPAAYAALIELPEGSERLALSDMSARANSALRFQYFPDSITSSKTVNWQPKDIPMASLPLYQWMNSGEHSVSFSATFSADVDVVAEKARRAENPVSVFERQGILDRNVDVVAAITWLRQYLLPVYSDQGNDRTALLASPPRKLLLWLPNSGIGLAGGVSMGASPRDSLVSVMTQCEVTYDAFFPTGQPRLATVQLAFAQIAQYSGSIVFPQSGRQMARAAYGANSQTFGYTLRPSRVIRFR